MAAKNGTKKKAPARKSSAGIASPMDAESVELIPVSYTHLTLPTIYSV